MPRFLALPERNDVPFSDLSGTLNPGGSFLVEGLARAGRSSTGVGSWFQGTYGALLLNPDGSYTYRLDNADPDTNVLGAGQTAEDRFTYSYAQNGVGHTDTITVRVTGIDEPGQHLTTATQTINYFASTTIGPLEQIHVTAIYAVIATAMGRERLSFVNYGWIRVEASYSDGVGVKLETAIGQTGTTELLNYGLIEAHAGPNAHHPVGAGANVIVNHGVIRAVSDAAGTSYSQAEGAGGLVLINTGTIEAISTLEAWAVITGSNGIVENSGLIYAQGATTQYERGIIGIRGYTSNAALITNSGTIHAVSLSNIQSMGISMFRDATNPYAYATIVNSGRIVADIAVHAFGTSVGGITGMHVTNSGYVEGDLDMDLGLNMLINQAGGRWIGDLRFGFHEDLLRNEGLILGAVTMGLEDDLFDGRGGTQIGLVDGGGGFDALLGGAGVDAIAGGDGSDRIDGGGGADILTGGADADVFVYDSVDDSTAAAFDTITDFQTGIDRIDLGALAPSSVGFSASGGYTMVTAQTAGGALTIRVAGTIASSDLITTPKGAAVSGSGGSDNLFAVVAGSTLNGLGGDDVLDGSDGDDMVNGGEGADLMRGGRGNDVYIVDNGNDRHIEFEGEGIDEVRTFVPYSLQAFVENISLLGTATIDVAGNRSDNVITGSAGHSWLYGREGNDVLIGGGGADIMDGGPGADIFVYATASDSVSAAPDRLALFETGIDRIDLRAVNPTSVTWQETMYGYWQAYAITNVVTVETAVGTMRINVDGKLFLSDFLLGGEIVGTGAADTLAGTAGGDVIIGKDGNDGLYGFGGADTLSGQAGDDLLDGGAGADRMTGGAGDDHYIVDDAQDVAWETFYQGYDTISASVSYTLAPRVFIEILETADRNGTAAINLTGNTLDNIIHGNAGNNILDGGVNVEDPSTYIPAGIDTLIGYGGDDTYLVDGGGDVVVEALGGGFDTVVARASFVLNADAEIEVIAASDQPTIYAGPVNLTGNGFAQTLRGNGDANILDGGGGADFLSGGAGNDRLIGGAGNDRLEGGAGADIFAFAALGDSSLYALRSDGAKFIPDMIVDFVSGQDRIDLAAIDAVAGNAGNDAFNFLGTGAFTGHAGELRYEVRGGLAHILADVDGNGLADMEIVANNVPYLAAADFIF